MVLTTSFNCHKRHKLQDIDENDVAVSKEVQNVMASDILALRSSIFTLHYMSKELMYRAIEKTSHIHGTGISSR